MLPERFGRAVNQYFAGLFAWALIITTLWPIETTSFTKDLLANPLGSGSTFLGLFFFITGPVISLGAAIESIAREGGKILTEKSKNVGKAYSFSFSDLSQATGFRRRHIALAFKDADAHIFDWVTGHLIRGKFAASWAILWVLSIVPLVRLFLNKLLSTTAMLSLVVLNVVIASFLFRWSLHQLSVYKHYLASMVEAEVSQDTDEGETDGTDYEMKDLENEF